MGWDMALGSAVGSVIIGASIVYTGKMFTGRPELREALNIGERVALFLETIHIGKVPVDNDNVGNGCRKK